MANIARRRMDPLSTWDDLLSPRKLQREIDRLFDDLFTSAAPAATVPRQFVPALEVTESDKDYLMKAELPGMSDTDINVEVDDNNRLTLRGEKKCESKESRGGYEYSERSYGEFVRTVQLPSGIDASKIEATFQNGVLELRMPKTAQARARAIPIGTGKAEPKKMEKMEETGNGSKAQEKAQAQPQPQPQPQK